MKFHTLYIFLAAVLFFQQVLALVGENQASVEDPALETSLKKEPNTLAADLIETLGWSETQSMALTSYINAIDQIGLIAGQDQDTVNVLDDFHHSVRQLLADAGYEYNDRQVLTRISAQGLQPEGFRDVIKNLISSLTGLLSKLAKSLKGIKPLSGIFKTASKLIKSLGKFLKGLLS